MEFIALTHTFRSYLSSLTYTIIPKHTTVPFQGDELKRPITLNRYNNKYTLLIGVPKNEVKFIYIYFFTFGKSTKKI